MIGQTTHRVRRGLGFVRATVIGGIFVLAPVVVLALITSKAVAVAYETVQPIVHWLPFHSVAGISLALCIAVGGLIVVCFFAGLLAHTTLARWCVRLIESAILSNLPGYTLMKSFGEGLVGIESRDSRRSVLVQWEHSAQIGFVMDELADGRRAVFIPGVPTPWSGQLHFVSPDRLQPLNVSVREAIEMLQRLGIESGRTLNPGPAAKPDVVSAAVPSAAQ